MERKCENCVSRLICPTKKENTCCMGFNDEQVFRGLLKMCLLGNIQDKRVDEILDFINEMQRR